MRTYDGINIQWPISELILSGDKTVETRTYPIPKSYLNREVLLVETPGKNGNFKSRIRGILVFTSCFQYRDSKYFYSDSKRHCVTPDSEWAWDPNKGKWGWEVVVKQVFKKPKPLNRRPGIKFCSNLVI